MGHGLYVRRTVVEDPFGDQPGTNAPGGQAAMSVRDMPPVLSRVRALVAMALAVFCVSQARGAEPGAEGERPPIEMGALFSDNAVLQRDMPLPVWGTAPPGAKVTVSFRERTSVCTADKEGRWKVVLDPLAAKTLGRPDEVPDSASMTVAAEFAGKGVTKTLTNLVTGDVWLCAGQSNMAGKLGSNKSGRYPAGTIEEANYPGLRQIRAPERGPWIVCTPETCAQFGKVAFFFGRGVYREARVPIGLVTAAVGGSNIESWLNQEPYATGLNYETLIAPMVGYGIRGMVWYQGESNVQDGLKYLPKLASLVTGWRKAWNNGDFPVCLVQLPGCGSPPAGDADPAGASRWAETRQAQFEALSLTNMGMAVTIDIGDVSLHPPNKYDTGVRLSRVALHNAYGFTTLVPTGPLYRSHIIEGDAVRIRFQYAASGLMVAEKTGLQPPVPSTSQTLQWLAIQAKDGRWHWADGRIDGTDLVVSNPDVKDPVAVRYACVDRPAGCLLYSRDGLPAAPFTTERAR